ncbi:MAG: phosphoglycerate mutase family protein, partial [archaeon]|nr:phosphoglycerate mutase family protein [archaeon]
LLATRKSQPLFHPDVPQRIVPLPTLPSVLLLLRCTAGASLICLANFSDAPQTLSPRLLLGALPAEIFARVRRHHFDVLSHTNGAGFVPALVDLRLGLVVAPYQSVWLYQLPDASITQQSLDMLLQTCPSPSGSQISPLPPAGPLRLPIEASLSSRLGLTYRPRFGAYSVVLLPEEGDQLPPPAAGSKLLHLVRHGQAMHHLVKQLQGGGGHQMCPCYRHTAKDEARERCPFLHLATFDAFLTQEGAREMALLSVPATASLIFSAPDTRCLHSAELVSEHCQLKAPLMTSELLRPLTSPHLHSRSCSRELLSAMFPGASFCGPAIDPETMLPQTPDAVAGIECRESIEQRILAFIDQVFERPEQEILVVGHLSWYWALIAPGSDLELLGARQIETNQEADLVELSDRGSAKQWLLHSKIPRRLSIWIHPN